MKRSGSWRSWCRNGEDLRPDSIGACGEVHCGFDHVEPAAGAIWGIEQFSIHSVLTSTK